MSDKIFNIGKAGGSKNGGTAPLNVSIPVISGLAEVGSQLTSTSGVWIGSPASFSYQWKRNGVAIDGQTQVFYNLVGDDANTNISVTVTAVNAYGQASSTSFNVVIAESSQFTADSESWTADSETVTADN